MNVPRSTMAKSKKRQRLSTVKPTRKQQQETQQRDDSKAVSPTPQSPATVPVALAHDEGASRSRTLSTRSSLVQMLGRSGAPAANTPVTLQSQPASLLVTSECGTVDRSHKHSTRSFLVQTPESPVSPSADASPKLSVPINVDEAATASIPPQAQPASVNATSECNTEGSRLSSYYSQRRQSSFHTQETEHEQARRSIVVVVSLFLLFMSLFILATVLAALLLSRQRDKPGRLPRYVSPTTLGVYRGWIAVSSARQCTNVSGKVFAKNGTIGDAAIATILCVCVAMPHKCGLGGGFVATYYNRRTQNATAVVVRPRAPGAANENMYVGNAIASLVGAKAVATFGELKGYELLLNVTGSRLNWKAIFEDAIGMAENGIEVYDQLAADIAAIADDLRNDAKEQLSSPDKMRVLRTGDAYYNKKLANTLRKIAGSDKKGRFFDSGRDVGAMVDELARSGGILTVEDFATFRGSVEASISVLLSQSERLFTTPVPTSGAILAFVVSVLDEFRREGVLPDNELTWHRFVEALKFGFARRFELGDPDAPGIRSTIEKVLGELLSASFSAAVALRLIAPESQQDARYYGLKLSSSDDHGSADVCIVAADGDALCLVSTINTPFGSRVYSNATGLWYNNVMHDFAMPYGVRPLSASHNNFIRPGLRPVSSLCPSVLVDADGDVLFAASSTGGPLAVSGLVQVLARSLWMKHTVKEAIDAGRLHNQLFPDNVVRHEETADRDVLAGLKQRGHQLAVSAWTGTVLAIKRVGEGVYAAGYDYRNLAIASSDGLEHAD